MSTLSIGMLPTAPYSTWIANAAHPTGLFFTATGGGPQALATAMSNGATAVRQALANGLLDLRGATVAETYTSLITDSTKLQYLGRMVFEAGVDETLATEIVDAGEALISALAAAVMETELYVKRALEGISDRTLETIWKEKRTYLESKLPNGTPALDDIQKDLPKEPIRLTSFAVNPNFSIATTNTLSPIVGPPPAPPPSFLLDTADSYFPSEVLVIHTNSKPADTLTPYDTETLSWTVNTSGIAILSPNGSVAWRNPANSAIFGVKIVVPFQVLGIGYSPYYQVMYKTPNDDSGGWVTTPDPGEPYSFPSSVGYRIQVKPTAGGSDLQLAINIMDLIH